MKIRIRISRKHCSIIALLLLVSCNSSSNHSGKGSEPSSHVESSEETKNKFARGEEIYSAQCAACHQPDGKGLAGTFPPLADSDYLMTDKTRAIKQIINGSSGEMMVNGKIYNGIMPAPQLTDEEVQLVTYFIMNAWGNEGGEVSADDVKKAKAQ